MEKSKGISVTEMLITLAVLAILASIAIPNYHQMMARMESYMLERELRQILNYSKYSAVAEYRRIAICPTTDYKRCANQRDWSKGIMIFYDEKNRNRVFDAEEALLYTHKLNLKYGTLQWRGFGVAGNIIFHDRHTNLSGSNGSFYYCNPHKQQLNKRIIVNPAGFIRTENGIKC